MADHNTEYQQLNLYWHQFYSLPSNKFTLFSYCKLGIYFRNRSTISTFTDLVNHVILVSFSRGGSLRVILVRVCGLVF